MIWSAGNVMRADALAISVLDRTFEHGLGLFETMRTWDGRTPLLERHCARVLASAAALGIPLDTRQLPGDGDVGRLLEAAGVKEDVVLRLVVSGGLSADRGSVVWMRMLPLPPGLPREGVAVGGPVVVPELPTLARHKTLNYWSKRLLQREGDAAGMFDTLLATPDGCVWETTRASVFLVASDTLITPPLMGPILPGIMRQVVLEYARAEGLAVDERCRALEGVDEAFLTNAVRGVIPVRSLAGVELAAPGPLTARIMQGVLGRLRDGGFGG